MDSWKDKKVLKGFWVEGVVGFRKGGLIEVKRYKN